MMKEPGHSTRKIYLTAALVFLLTAWFSVGYNHFDEHFQVIEFAGLKLGLTEKAELPWEYGCMMRPALQPALVVALYKVLSLAGLTDPFTVAFFIRLLSAIFTFFSIHLIIRMYAPGITNRQLLYAFMLLSFFLWFVPYNSARFSSETFSGRIFLAGMAWFFLRKNIRPIDYMVLGIVLGISFVTRYQVAFMIIGFAAWLLFIRKSGFMNLLVFIAGIIFATSLGVLIDRWYYGEWVLTSWNYFYQNMVLHKAATFGTAPWWYYIEQTFMNAFPPLSIIYIIAVFAFFIFYPKDMLTWTLVPFLAAHFLIPHKEIRFLFPMMGLLPVMIIRTTQWILERKGYEVMERRNARIPAKLFWYLNMVMLVVLIFRPADDRIALYKKIWNACPGPAKLYYTAENPYHRAKVDANFYKRGTLAFERTDSLNHVIPARDTITLAVTGKPDLGAGDAFRPVLIYSSLPRWVKKFNVNNWIERTSIWYVYELKPLKEQLFEKVQ